MKLLLFSLCVILALTSAKHHNHHKRWVRQDGFNDLCSFHGYKPGGGRKVVSPLTSLTAQRQYNVLKNILHFGSTTAGIEETEVQHIVEYSQKMESIGLKLAISQGIFGSVMGGLSSLVEPSTMDVLDSIDRAIQGMVNEVLF